MAIFSSSISSLDTEGETVEGVKIHAAPFANREIVPEDKFDADLFDFGHVLTVHKSQGSQWDHVVFINDNYGHWPSAEAKLHDRWFYTALSRAVKTVTIIRPERKQGAQTRKAAKAGAV